MSGTLVIQTAFLGDVVLTTPLLTRLAETFGPVDVLATPAAAVLLRQEDASQRRPDSEHVEERLGHDGAGHVLRRIAAARDERRVAANTVRYRPAMPPPCRSCA